LSDGCGRWLVVCAFVWLCWDRLEEILGFYFLQPIFGFLVSVHSPEFAWQISFVDSVELREVLARCVRYVLEIERSRNTPLLSMLVDWGVVSS
jgi:hypothetical protein